MLKKLIIFSFLSFLFSFSYASIVDPDKGKNPEKEQKCKKKHKAAIERESKKPSEYTGTEQIVEEEQQKAMNEESEQEFSSKREQQADIHSFNFLYYLIHHYKFSDFIQ